MTITHAPKKTVKREKDLDAFIGSAPDCPPQKTGGFMKCHKRQISLTISPELLDQFDALAARQGQTRSSMISMLLFQAIKRDQMAEDPQK